MAAAIGPPRGRSRFGTAVNTEPAVVLANYFHRVAVRTSLPLRNAVKISPKANTPGAVTWADTPKRFLSTQKALHCMTLNWADVATPRINPQVLHNPLNTGVDGYAHTMHSFMNRHPLEYSPATFTFVQSRDDAGAVCSGVRALAYAAEWRLSNVCSDMVKGR